MTSHFATRNSRAAPSNSFSYIGNSRHRRSSRLSPCLPIAMRRWHRSPPRRPGNSYSNPRYTPFFRPFAGVRWLSARARAGLIYISDAARRGSPAKSPSRKYIPRVPRARVAPSSIYAYIHPADLRLRSCYIHVCVCVCCLYVREGEISLGINMSREKRVGTAVSPATDFSSGVLRACVYTCIRCAILFSLFNFSAVAMPGPASRLRITTALVIPVFPRMLSALPA